MITEGVLALLVLVLSCVTVLLALRNKKSCLYGSKNRKAFQYGVFGILTASICILMIMMFNYITQSFNQVNHSICAIHNYNVKLILGAQEGDTDSWAGLEPLYTQLLEAEGPVSDVFNSYDILFSQSVVNESFNLATRTKMDDWVKELQSYRNLTVSNFENTESILLRFSD